MHFLYDQFRAFLHASLFVYYPSQGVISQGNISLFTAVIVQRGRRMDTVTSVTSTLTRFEFITTIFCRTFTPFIFILRMFVSQFFNKYSSSQFVTMKNCVTSGLAYMLASGSLKTLTCHCVFTFLQGSDCFPVMVQRGMPP